MLTVHWITNDGRPAIMEMQKLSGNWWRFHGSADQVFLLQQSVANQFRTVLPWLSKTWSADFLLKTKAGLGLEWLRFSCVFKYIFRVCLFSYKVWARDGSKLRFQFGQDDQTPEEVVWPASFGCLGNSWQTWSAYIEFLWFSFSPHETHHYASRRSKTHHAKS